MPSDNKILLASAGSGKTSKIVIEACDDTAKKSTLITYTINGKDELVSKAYEHIGYVPSHVKISTWYSFVLHHFVRPYQNHKYDKKRVVGINFKRGSKILKIPKVRSAFFFSSLGKMRLDKVTDFACVLNEETHGLSIQRFEKIFDHLYIDEAQDLSGYDLELIELLLRSSVKVTLIGDHRQATYSTNDNPKNKAYWGAKIVNKFLEWEKAGLAEVIWEQHSYRCNQEICDFADAFHPDAPNTTSHNKNKTGHDGVFAIKESEVDSYIAAYGPQPLRYSRATKGIPGNPMNYGVVKGMTFDRTLIYPNGKLKKYLETGNLKDAGAELAKLYVAITRARYSVAFVIPDGFTPAIVPIFST